MRGADTLLGGFDSHALPLFFIEIIEYLPLGFYPQIVPNGLRPSNPPASGAAQAAAASSLGDHLYLCSDALLKRSDM